jgi:hypothetical protein
MRFKAMTLITAAAAAVALGPTLAAVGSNASAGDTPCTQVSGTYYLYVTQGTTDYYVASINHTVPSSHPELKSFPGNTPNGTAALTKCDVTGQDYFAFEHTSAGHLYALSQNHSNGSTVDFDPVMAAGPNDSMWWTRSGSNPYTFRNMYTGNYLRVSNQGIGEYKPVVAGQHATPWNQVVH